MSRSARVTSIDALQVTAAAVQKFRGDVTGAMDEVELESRRALGWIHHDRKDYWTRELRRSGEAVTQARLQLQQARTARRVADHEPACDEEKRILARAQRRHETAQRKVDAVKRWERAIDHAVDEYQRARILFLSWVDTDLVKAVAALNRMSASLESYTSLGAPTASEEQLLGGYAAPAAESAASPEEPNEPEDMAAAETPAVGNESPAQSESIEPTEAGADAIEEQEGNRQ